MSVHTIVITTLHAISTKSSFQQWWKQDQNVKTKSDQKYKTKVKTKTC